MQFCFIIQVKFRIHHYYVLFFVLRVRFHIWKRKHSSRMKRMNDWQTPVKTLPFLAVEGQPHAWQQVRRWSPSEQVWTGRWWIPRDLSHEDSFLWTNRMIDRQTDSHTTKNITFPGTTYADGTCASGKENSSSRSQIWSPVLSETNQIVV